MSKTSSSPCCRKPSAGSAEPSAERTLTAGQRVALVALDFYKTTLSPLTFSACKFYPSCSAYAREAIEIHGLARGTWLAAKRLLRCRPFSPGGIDPVPAELGRADV